MAVATQVMRKPSAGRYPRIVPSSQSRHCTPVPVWKRMRLDSTLWLQKSIFIAS
ncbi:MAG: hypothetical protein BWZ02_03309 [Lentisphaerae bacterium ADurb.BinA184]|nr:MAG: hypothetical protein BWZ02_03309 [Lentisphaerae bacterium ADurb.BinA184]